MPLLLVHFARYGPYHHARLKSAAATMGPLGWEVIGLETAGNDATYAWDPRDGNASGPQVVTAFPGRVHEEVTAADCKRVLHPLLDELHPDAMAIAGWAGPDALSCLSWCRKNDVRRIVMSETREADGRRVWWKERIKRYLISRFDGALVGGKSHREYLVKLGMPAERIRLGYNVVDNAYFRKGRAMTAGRAVTPPPGREVDEPAVAGPPSEEEVGRPGGPSLPYFLASNRFIERKNLARLIEAYASYNQQSPVWPLVLLGDGELKPALIAQCHRLGLNVIESAPWEGGHEVGGMEHEFMKGGHVSGLRPDAACLLPHASCSSPSVYFPGFRQIEELPRFYARAGCFIHPALEEPWGLVINEAMACGLPVLSSSNVGAAEELVDDGVNGWRFDAENVEKLCGLMSRISAFDFPLSAFGNASARILEERCPTAAFGRGLANLLNR